MPPDTPPLYVSCVDGKPVTRYRLSGGRGDPIGAVRGAPTEVDAKAGVFARRDARPRWTYDLSRVVMIPGAEVEKFGRVYERAIEEKNLVRRTAEDFEQQNNCGAVAPLDGSAPPAGGNDT